MTLKDDDFARELENTYLFSNQKYSKDWTLIIKILIHLLRK